MNQVVITEIKNLRDTSLLFGILAAQLRFVSKPELALAASIISAKPEADLSAKLLELGLLTESDRDTIARLADRLINAHHGDARAALADFGGQSAVEDAFGAPVSPDRPAPDASTAESTLALSDHDQAALTATAPAPARLGPGPGSEHITLEHPGRYVIKSEYGRGAIGRVLVAFDEHIGRDIALKELMTELLAQGSGPSQVSELLAAEAAARFLQEARITGQLEHPGIVPVYEIARREDGSIYYTMKLVRGQTLKERIQQCRTIPERLTLLPHFQALCQAVAFAHSKNVVHRDLKPANVMVGEFGETVVLDWGLASVKGLVDERAEDIEESLRLIKEAGASETVEGQPIGTPTYMSPEQARGRVREIDERSDVWGLGAMLYELLTGQVPFTGRYAREVMDQVIANPVVPVAVRAPQAPAELGAIAMKCLAKNPEDRYAHAGELARDVSDFLAGGLVSAYDYSMTTLVMRWVRKRWPLVATAAAALVLLISFYTYSYIRVNRERDRALVSEGIARQQEMEALKNLAESYLIMGRWAESAREWAGAQVYYAKSLTLHDTLEARVSLNHVTVFPRLTLASIADMEAKPGVVWAAGFTPAGPGLVVGRDDQAVNLFDIASGKLLHRFHQTGFSATLIVLSPGADLIAAAGKNGELLLFDADSGQLRHTLTGHRAVISAAAFSPDGRTLATAAVDYVMKIWDTQTGQELRTLEWDRDDVAVMLFSPDGAALATGNADSRLKIWDPATGQTLHLFEGHEGPITALAFTPDGFVLVSGSADRAAKVWDTDSGEMLFSLEGHKDEVLAVAVSPDGVTAATASADHSIRLWDLTSGSLLHYLEGHVGAVYSIAFSPDSALLASNGNDLFLKLWDVASGAALFSRGGQIGEVRFSPAGDRLFGAGSDYTLKLWEVRKDSVYRDAAGAAFAAEVFALSPDGKLTAAGGPGGEIAVWTTRDRKLVRTIAAQSDAITALVFGPGHQTLISSGKDGGLKLWDPATGGLVREFDHPGELATLAVSPDAQTLAGAGPDKTIGLWRMADGQRTATLTGHESAVKKMMFTPDGKRLVTLGYLENVVRLWDVADGAGLPGFDFGQDYVEDAALSPDGRVLAVALADNTIILYTLDPPALVQKLEGHECGVRAVVFTPDGKSLASASCDQTVKLWDVQDGARLASMARHKDSVEQIAVSPDGTIIASTGRDLTVKLWGLPAGNFLHSLDTGSPDPLLEIAFSPDGSGLLSRDTANAIRLWTLETQIMTGDPDKLLAEAERATGLKVLGMKLHPWKPTTGQVSAAPMPQGL